MKLQVIEIEDLDGNSTVVESVQEALNEILEIFLCTVSHDHPVEWGEVCRVRVKVMESREFDSLPEKE